MASATEAPRVLLVDSSAHQRCYLRLALEGAGYRVAEAACAADAWERLHEEPCRAVLLEFELPDLRGDELCRELRAAPGGDGLVVIFTTAHAYTDPTHLREAGADWYFPKPVSPNYLCDKLRELLAPERLDPAPDRQDAFERFRAELDRLAALAGCDDFLLERDGAAWFRVGVIGGERLARVPLDLAPELGGLRLVAPAGRAEDVARLKGLCEHAARQVELELEREGLCRELGSTAEDLASMFRTVWNQSKEAGTDAYLDFLLHEAIAGHPARSAAFLSVESGGVRALAWTHERPEDDAVPEAAMEELVERHRPLLLGEGDPSLAGFPGAAAAILAPFPLHDHIMGCLAVWSARARELDDDATRRISLFAHQGGAILHTAALRGERERAERLRREHELGGQIQEALLRSHTDTKPAGVEVVAFSDACRQVAGDFYASLQIAPDCIDVVVGDVMGKGLPAAVFATAVKSELLRILVESRTSFGGARPGPDQVVELLNGELSRDLERFRSFSTLYYGRVDLSRRRFEFVDCGHTNALHYRAKDGCVVELVHNPEGVTNLPLGVFPTCSFEAASVEFEEGDAFLLYSDGVTEACLGDEQFGLERLQSAFAEAASLGAEQAIGAVREAVASFLDGAAYGDDLTVLAVCVGAEGDVLRSVESITLPAESGHLERLHDFVGHVLAANSGAGFGDVRRNMIQVAAVEAATNIVRHAYPNGVRGEYRVEYERTDSSIRLRFLDRGQPFNPKDAPPPPLESLADGGYGVFLIHEIADEVTYEHAPAGVNQLTLTFQTEAQKESDMNLDYTEEQNALIVSVPTKRLDCDSSSDFREEMRDVVHGAARVVLDLEALEFIDSSGLGAILSCLRDITESGGDMKLCGLSDPVRAVFELVRMHRILEIHDDQGGALQAFG
ncbi:MAG: anti-sigma factor antagonist [Planctomycetota bacterium]